MVSDSLQVKNDVSGDSGRSGEAAKGRIAAVFPGPVPLWLRLTLGIVIVSSLGLMVLLGFILAGVFFSRNQSAISLDTAKGQLVVGAVTGVLTIAIASGTIWYARLTHFLVAQAEATRSEIQNEIRIAGDQLALAQMNLRFGMRPVLADVPRGWIGTAEGPSDLDLEGYGAPFMLREPGEVVLPTATTVFAYLVVPLRNIGSGLAVITGGRLDAEAASVEEYSLSKIVVPVNELTYIIFAVRRDLPLVDAAAEALISRTNIEVLISYTNALGDDPRGTRLSLGRDPSAPHKMRVLSVSFLEDVLADLGIPNV
jgi:hypothetical protein